MSSSHNLSYWEQQSYIGDPDYLIVGAGIVGMITALEIHKASPSANVLVVDKSVVGSGASSRNAGFACIGSLGEIIHDCSFLGESQTIETISKRYNGLQRLVQLCQDFDIGYKPSGGYEVLRTKEEFIRVADCLTEWNDKLSDLTGYKKTFTIGTNTDHNDFWNKGIVNHAEGLLDTGKLNVCLESLLNEAGIRVIKGLTLADYKDNSDVVVVSFSQLNQEIRTEKLVLCTNAFTKELIPRIDLEPCRNQVLVTSKVDAKHLTMGYHMSQGYIYFREVHGRVLIGGARHLFPEENNTIQFELNDANSAYLLELLRDSIIPNQDFTIDYHWSGILCGGTARQPIVKSLSQNVFMGVRLGGMGVAIGSMIATELAQLVQS